MYKASVDSAPLCCVGSLLVINSFLDQAVWSIFSDSGSTSEEFRASVWGKLIASESFLHANEVAGVFRFFEREESHTH